MDYDSWKLSSGQDDEAVFCRCDHCGGEIYEGETYKYIPMFGTSVHEDCLSDYFLETIDAELQVAGQE